MLPRHVVAMIAQDGWRSAHPASGGASEERAYTGMRVRVLSAAKASAYRPGAKEVAIAIRGPIEKDTPLSPRFVDVPRLIFDDTSPYATYAASGQDNPSTISDAQADAVAAFVLRHRGRPRPAWRHRLPVSVNSGATLAAFHMRSRTGSGASMCALLALVVAVTACKGPSHRVIPAAADAPPATVAAPAIGNVADVPAGDSATFDAREYLVGDTVFSFADYHTVAADIVHLERRTDSLITVASLVLPMRYRGNVMLHECKLDGTWDPEIMALYPDGAEEPQSGPPATSPTANAAVHPRFAWRASRARERFESIDPRRVLCSFANVVD